MITYRMPFAQRLNIKEGQDALALEEFQGGDFAYVTTVKHMFQQELVRTEDATVERRAQRPLMILQKTQAAIAEAYAGKREVCFM